MIQEYKLIGAGPFFTYRSGNGKYGLSANMSQTIGLATGAIFDSPEQAIAAGIERIMKAGLYWQKRAIEAESVISDMTGESV